jgi:putative transcriptional regulator
MTRFTLDPDKAPRLSVAQRDRMGAMTEADIETAATDDPENPRLSELELNRLRSARAVRQSRRRSGLSQAAFARTFRINVARLRDLEQGRTEADSALLAYLIVIEKDPEVVRRALES